MSAATRFHIKFQSTLPARGATTTAASTASSSLISIHAPRTGSDTPLSRLLGVVIYFNPRSPHGERRAPASGRGRRCSGISIHAPRTGSDRADEKCGNRTEISIHAPRTGSDRAERSPLIFSSNFNPRSPHGERHNTNYSSRQAISISIHAPRTGSDQKRRLRRQRRKIFQSTLPARGATASDADVRHFAHISIHAPRTGSDIFCKSTPDSFAIFQSTLPARGATPWVFPFWKYPHRHFNPRSPHGERLSFWNK